MVQLVSGGALRPISVQQEPFFLAKKCYVSNIFVRDKSLRSYAVACCFIYVFIFLVFLGMGNHSMPLFLFLSFWFGVRHVILFLFLSFTFSFVFLAMLFEMVLLLIFWISNNVVQIGHQEMPLS